jgi:hypothetical protein
MTYIYLMMLKHAWLPATSCPTAWLRHTPCPATLCGHKMQHPAPLHALLCCAGSPHVTAWDTAAAVGVPSSCVAKTMTLLVDQQPHLVVTRGDQRIDMHKARSHCCSSQLSRSCQLRAQCISLTGVVAAAGTAAAARQACAVAAVPAGAGPSQHWLGGGCQLLRLQRTFRTARLPVAAAVKLLV